MAGQWALDNRVPFEAFEARSNTYHGNRAGNVRNARMLREGRPDLVIPFEGGSGTQDMICKTLGSRDTCTCRELYRVDSQVGNRQGRGAIRVFRRV